MLMDTILRLYQDIQHRTLRFGWMNNERQTSALVGQNTLVDSKPGSVTVAVAPPSPVAVALLSRYCRFCWWLAMTIAPIRFGPVYVLMTSLALCQ